MLATIGNISEGGLFLKTSNLFPVGERVSLSFRPDDRSEVEAVAQVVWHSTGRSGAGRSAYWGMGLKLVEMRSGREAYCLCLGGGAQDPPCGRDVR
jgi:Tfp pilus assembly protein PilZ